MGACEELIEILTAITKTVKMQLAVPIHIKLVPN